MESWLDIHEGQTKDEVEIQLEDRQCHRVEISNAAKRSSWLMMVCPEIQEVSGFFRTDRRQFPSIIQSREEAISGGRSLRLIHFSSAAPLTNSSRIDRECSLLNTSLLSTFNSLQWAVISTIHATLMREDGRIWWKRQEAPLGDCLD